jgi:sugar phosphate isomerase/epimerase
MLPIHVAVATRSFHQPIKRAVQTAREIGVQGIQLDARNELKPADLSETGRRQFLHLLEEHGLAVASVTFPLSRSLYDPAGLEGRLDALKATMQFAYQLRAKVVTARVGRIPAEAESADYRTLWEVASDLAQHGNRVGVILAVTPMNDPPAALAAFLKSVTAGPIGFHLDPAALVMGGQDPVEAARGLYDLIAHVQIRDAVRDMDGAGSEVPVGRGEVDWDELLALLEEARYQQWLTVERTQGDDKIGDAARAVQFLKRVAGG